MTAPRPGDAFHLDLKLMSFTCSLQVIRRFSQTFPDPDSGIFNMREWPLTSGNEISIRLSDPSRVNKAMIAQQYILVLAGVLFGLVPATIPQAIKASNNLRRRADQ